MYQPIGWIGKRVPVLAAPQKTPVRARPADDEMGWILELHDYWRRRGRLIEYVTKFFVREHGGLGGREYGSNGVVVQ